MINLAVKAFLKRKYQVKNQKHYLKGLLNYHDKNYGQAIKHFRKSKISSARYMEFISHVKSGNTYDAYNSLEEYHAIVADWHPCEEKEEALQRVAKLRTMLEKRSY